MTSDAKIGLLLGLVFIFVIAFIINGLPNLRPQSTKAEVTMNAMRGQDENLGLADREQKARETISWGELLDAQMSEPAAPVAGATSLEPAAAGDDAGAGVGSTLSLPGSDSLERLAQGLEDIMKNLADASEPGTAAEKTTEPAPAVEVATFGPQPQPESVAASRPRAAVAAKVATSYVVQEGENLASVAKKVYGAVEGNRIVNIQRIYEANRDILPSADKVRAGQELVVPPLEPATAAATRADRALPKALFEKVQAIGKGRIAGTGMKETEKPTAGRWYVVQQDDSLWRIAASQLGSGARYQEIVKLNPDILKDPDALDMGMRLCLPPK